MDSDGSCDDEPLSSILKFEEVGSTDSVPVQVSLSSNVVRTIYLFPDTVSPYGIAKAKGPPLLSVPTQIPTLCLKLRPLFLKVSLAEAQP